MSFYQLLVLQFIAHFLTDFSFQSDKNAREKNALGYKSRFLRYHVIIVFVLSMVFSFHWAFIPASLIIAVFHGILDGFKKNMNVHPRFGMYSFYIDQSLHLLFITLVVYLYHQHFSPEPLFSFPIPEKVLVIALGYLICTKTANIVVKETFRSFDIRVSSSDEAMPDIPNAGKLIGILERWLVLTFILVGQFQAIGFLLAAKSILRYNDVLKTEYVLVGTMLSFGIAIACGLIVIYFPPGGILF